MTDNIKNVLPRDAATISEIQASDGFRAAAPAAKFKDHVSKDAGQLSEAWSALGWYGKDTASFAFLAAKTIQSGYGVNTLEARLRVLALLKIIRPTSNGGRMPKRPPEGSPYGEMWPHQRLGYSTWGEFVLGPAAGISGPDGSYIKGPGLGFGAGIDPSDPDAKAKQDRALAYERDLFRGYERLMALLPETALPHNPDDIRAHYRQVAGGELTVELLHAMGQREKKERKEEQEKNRTTRCTVSQGERKLAKNPTRAAATVQRAAAATGDPAGYLRQIAEAIAPPAPTPAECIAELARRYDRQFLEELCVALADYITTTQP